MKMLQKICTNLKLRLLIYSGQGYFGLPGGGKETETSEMETLFGHQVGQIWSCRALVFWAESSSWDLQFGHGFGACSFINKRKILNDWSQKIQLNSEWNLSVKTANDDGQNQTLLIQQDRPIRQWFQLMGEPVAVDWILWRQTQGESRQSGWEEGLRTTLQT